MSLKIHSLVPVLGMISHFSSLRLINEICPWLIAEPKRTFWTWEAAGWVGRIELARSYDACHNSSQPLQPPSLCAPTNSAFSSQSSRQLLHVDQITRDVSLFAIPVMKEVGRRLSNNASALFFFFFYLKNKWALPVFMSKFLAFPFLCNHDCFRICFL